MSCAASTTSTSRYLSEPNRFAARIMVADDHGAGNKRHDEWAPTRPPIRRVGSGGWVLRQQEGASAGVEEEEVVKEGCAEVAG